MPKKVTTGFVTQEFNDESHCTVLSSIFFWSLLALGRDETKGQPNGS